MLVFNLIKLYFLFCNASKYIVLSADGFFSSYQLAETDIVSTLLVVVNCFTCIYRRRNERIDKLGTFGNTIFFGWDIPERSCKNGENYWSRCKYMIIVSYVYYIYLYWHKKISSLLLLLNIFLGCFLSWPTFCKTLSCKHEESWQVKNRI